jgi:NTP pyrophosphatase (non-canonical NTP hydrolase)
VTFDEYQTRAIATLTKDHAYGDLTAELMAQILGLVGESGEVAEKVKKLIRDKAGAISDEDKQELYKELGDILWYVNAVAHLLGSNLDQVARQNISKVQSRYARGVTKGSGDNR